VTMRLEILRQTSIAGQPARVGDVVEVDGRDAWLLLGSGKAKQAPAPAAVVAEPVMQDPEPTQRKPRTRRTKTHGPT
jgi:hypothetical protein